MKKLKAAKYTIHSDETQDPIQPSDLKTNIKNSI